MGLLGVGRNETVHVHDSLLGQTLAHSDGSVVNGRLELGGSNKSSRLKLSKAVANDLTSSELAVLSLGSISLLGSIVLTEALDSNLLSHVELVANRGSTDIEPVLRVWRELFLASSLNVLSPLCVINIIKLEIDWQRLVKENATL